MLKLKKNYKKYCNNLHNFKLTCIYLPLHQYVMTLYIFVTN